MGNKNMNMRHRQSGMSALGVLAIMIMVGFFAMCGIKMVPAYMEYLTVKQVVTGVATEFESGVASIPDLRRKIANLFNTNQIYALSPRDVKVFRKKRVTYIDANYEFRTPIAWRIDGVMKFDDLKFVVGEAVPE